MLEKFKETGQLTEELGKELRRWREEHCLSRYALSKMLGVESATIGRWENAQTSTVQQSLRGIVVELLEGRIEERIGKVNLPAEYVPRPELSAMAASISSIYNMCVTHERRQRLFEMLDALKERMSESYTCSKD